MADHPNKIPSTLAEQLADWIRLRKTKDLLDAIADPTLRRRVEDIAKKAVSPSIITRAVATAERGLTTLEKKAGQSSRPVVLATLLGLAGFGSWMLPWISHPTTAKAPVDSTLAAPTLASINYDPERGKQQYLLGLYSKVLVVPPPKQGIKIDGNLDDWNDVGKFSTRLRYKSGGYAVTGMMMADDDRLYIGARIGDPYPMKGEDDEQTQALNGGGLQVWLDMSDGKGGPESDEIVHLDLWYHSKSKAARLRVAHGIDNHDPRNVEQKSGFEGMFLEINDPVSRGYVLEYAIPWKSLKKTATPAKISGEHRLTWNVFWSNADGKDWQIKLVEVFSDTKPPNEDEGKDKTNTDPETWGTGTFGS